MLFSLQSSLSYIELLNEWFVYIISLQKNLPHIHHDFDERSKSAPPRFFVRNCQAYFTPWKMQQSIWGTSNHPLLLLFLEIQSLFMWRDGSPNSFLSHSLQFFFLYLFFSPPLTYFIFLVSLYLFIFFLSLSHISFLTPLSFFLESFISLSHTLTLLLSQSLSLYLTH